MHNWNVEVERSNENSSLECMCVDQIGIVKTYRFPQLVACAQIIERVDAASQVLYSLGKQALDYWVFYFVTLYVTGHELRVKAPPGECLSKPSHVACSAPHVHSGNYLHHSHVTSPI